MMVYPLINVIDRQQKAFEVRKTKTSVEKISLLLTGSLARDILVVIKRGLTYLGEG
jgi:hypothetical protein